MNNSQETVNQGKQLDLNRLLVICRTHIKMLVGWTALVAVFAFVVAEFLVVPQYTASTQILVNQKHGNDSAQAYNNQQVDIQMINTYKDIITNQVILREASKQLDNPVRVVTPARKAVYRENAAGRRVLIRASKPAVVERTGNKPYHVSTSQLKDSISVQTKQNSQVFTLNVKTDNAAKSAAIANTVASVFKHKIKKIMSVNNVTIVSNASVPTEPSFPNKKLFVLAGALVGLLGSFMFLVIKDLTDTTIKGDDFMTNQLGLTNQGAVYHIHMKQTNNSYQGQHGHRRV